MIKDKNIVCDYTKIILNDGKAILPGYIEIKDGKVYEWTAELDPANNDKRPWSLKNRIAYATKKLISCPHSEKEIKLCEGKHFITKGAMNKFIQELA